MDVFRSNLKEVRVEGGCIPRGCLLLYDILKPNQSSLSSRIHKVLCAWGPAAVISLIKVRDRVWCLFRSLLVKLLNQPWKGSRTKSGENTFFFCLFFFFVLAFLWVCFLLCSLKLKWWMINVTLSYVIPQHISTNWNSFKYKDCWLINAGSLFKQKKHCKKCMHIVSKGATYIFCPFFPQIHVGNMTCNSKLQVSAPAAATWGYCAAIIRRGFS